MIQKWRKAEGKKMTIPYEVDSLESIDGDLKVKDLYKEVDGKFQFDIKGAVPESKYKKLSSDLDTIRGEYGSTKSTLESYGGRSVDDILALETEIAKLRDTSGKTAEFDFDNMTDEQRRMVNTSTVSLYEQRLNNANAERDKLKAEFENKVKEYKSKLHGGAIERAMRDEMHKRKSPASAVDDGLRLARDELVYREDVKADSEIGHLFTKEGDIPFSTFIDEAYEQRGHWLPNSVSGNPRPGNRGNYSSEREAAYKAAEEKGDIQGMIKNAPPQSD